MTQVFRPRANGLVRGALIGGVLAVCTLGWAVTEYYKSSYNTGVDNPLPQPVPFSHKHHVAGLGIDCRFCHTTVETQAFAGIPPTSTCMTCHVQIWTNATLLAPVRESLATNTPLQWRRVHDLPDFVYFNHSIHVNKGVGCSTCHGAIDRMPLTAKACVSTVLWQNRQSMPRPATWCLWLNGTGWGRGLSTPVL